MRKDKDKLDSEVGLGIDIEATGKKIDHLFRGKWFINKGSEQEISSVLSVC